MMQTFIKFSLTTYSICENFYVADFPTEEEENTLGEDISSRYVDINEKLIFIFLLIYIYQ